MKFVWRTPVLRVALLLELATGLFGHNAALITILVRDVLNAGPESLGLLMSATGAGALIGMTLLLTFPVKQHGRLILTLGVLYAGLWAGVGVSHLIWLSALLLLALGTVDSMWGVTRNTLAQLLTTDALRGRVMSVVMLVTRGASQLGRVQSGFTVGLIGASASTTSTRWTDSSARSCSELPSRQVIRTGSGSFSAGSMSRRAMDFGTTSCTPMMTCIGRPVGRPRAVSTSS